MRVSVGGAARAWMSAFAGMTGAAGDGVGKIERGVAGRLLRRSGTRSSQRRGGRIGDGPRIKAQGLPFLRGGKRRSYCDGGCGVHRLVAPLQGRVWGQRAFVNFRDELFHVEQLEASKSPLHPFFQRGGQVLYSQWLKSRFAPRSQISIWERTCPRSSASSCTWQTQIMGLV